MSEKPDTNEIDNPEEYEKLQEQEGVSREGAARRADSDSEKSDEQEDSQTYEKWTDEELEEKAREAGIQDYKDMGREELIEALRDKENNQIK